MNEDLDEHKKVRILNERKPVVTYKSKKVWKMC